MTPRSLAASIDVYGLTVQDQDGYAVLRDVSFSLPSGARLGIVGESGAGKTALALSLLGHFRPGLRLIAGSVRVAGQEVLTASPSDLRDYRHTVISYLGQDPAAALTPHMRIVKQVEELVRDRRSTTSAGQRLEAVGLPGDSGFARRYPHELSVGQLQRVAIARALALAPDPAVLVLDEPSASLDLMTRRLIIQEIERQVNIRGITLVMVSHDLSLVARTADRLLVLHKGEIVEQGQITATLAKPKHAHTRELVAACDEVPQKVMTNGAGPDERRPLLSAAGLVASYGQGKTRSRVVDGLDLSVEAGECLALIGMSGAGKSTVVKCLLGLLEPDAGTIEVEGTRLAPRVQDRTFPERRTVQFVPQDPQGSLNPRRRVGDALQHALRSTRGLSRSDAEAEARALMDKVRLSPTLLMRFPRQLSGGERQRIAIARALAARPRVLICDEVTSALDVSVEASILELIDQLKRESHLAVLLIAHYLRVVRRIADRVSVLHDGKVVEHGPVPKIFASPQHEFTRSILAADQTLTEVRKMKLRRSRNVLNGSGVPTTPRIDG